MKFAIFTPDGFLCYVRMWSWETAAFIAEVTGTFKCVVKMDLALKRIELL